MSNVLNIDRLRRKLARLPVVATAHIRSEMEKTAERIIATMKNLVPTESGALQESIGWTWGKAPKGSLVLAEVKGKSFDDLTLTIYAGNEKAYYARWVEFGTAPHINGGKFKGTKNPGTNARPFFYVSWRANKKSAVRAVRKAARDAAKKVAAGS